MKTKTKLFGTILAIVGSFFTSALIHASPAENARLIVKRSADFGINESVKLAIDGVEVAVLGLNQNYNAALPPGKHVVSITTNPKTYPDQSPNQILVNAKPGKSYNLTAVWDDSERASLVEQ